MNSKFVFNSSSFRCGGLRLAFSLLIAAFAQGTAHRTQAADAPTEQAALAKIKEQSPSSLPRRTILLVIDGLAVGAIERLPMVHLEKLKAEGVYYRELVLPLAAHPRHSTNDQNNPLYYPWSCSIPNPIMMTGTVFIGQPGIKETLLQHSYKRAGKETAFLVDADAYTEIAGGYDTYRADWDPNDDAPVFPAVKQLIEEKNPYFIRMHLQSPGGGGYMDRRANRTIWDEQAEYRRRTIKADTLVNEFVHWLKEKGLWEETVLIICGDHGQADRGGHAAYEPLGDKTSLIIAGKGIKKGVTFPYAEMADLAPTIAYLQDVPTPKYSQGRILFGALRGGPDQEPSQRSQEKLNDIMLRYHALMNKHPALAGDALTKDFLVIEQIGTWHKKFHDLPTLVAHQQETLKKLESRAQP
jgi:hypothetical protein